MVWKLNSVVSYDRSLLQITVTPKVW